MIIKSQLEIHKAKLGFLILLKKKDWIVFKDIMEELEVLTGQVDFWLVDLEMVMLVSGILE